VVRSCRPLVLLLALLASTAPAEGDRPSVDVFPEPLPARQEGVWRYLSVPELARAIGAPVEARDGVLTLRASAGVLTVFAGQPDALWQAAGSGRTDEVAAASPVLVADGGWYLPEDLVGLLGVSVDGDLVTLPSGQVRLLEVARPPLPAPSRRSELVQLGPGVEALRLYAASAHGPDTVSLLAVDLALLSLAFPDQREALDLQLRDLHADKALFLVVTALGRAAWDPAIYVAQDGVEVLLRAPLAVQVLEGDPAAVTPARPVAAVAFLPGTFDVRRPMELRWAGATGVLTLRR
jgi:hypothetical protein